LVGSKLAVIVFNAKLWESSTFMCKFQAAVGWKGPSKRRGYYDERRESTPLCGHREDCSPCVRAAASTLPTAAVGIPPGPRLCARILRFGALGSGSGSSPRLGMEYANRKFGRKRVGMSKCFSTETLDSFVPLAMFFFDIAKRSDHRWR